MFHYCDSEFKMLDIEKASYALCVNLLRGKPFSRRYFMGGYPFQREASRNAPGLRTCHL